MIVGTTHNLGPINMSVEQAAKALIKNGEVDEGILNKIEMSVRAYDPWISWATHRLDGDHGVSITISDKNNQK